MKPVILGGVVWTDHTCSEQWKPPVEDRKTLDQVLTEYAAAAFKPYFHFDYKRNRITVYYSGEADYTEQLTADLEVHRSQRNKEIVGFSAWLPCKPNHAQMVAVREELDACLCEEGDGDTCKQCIENRRKLAKLENE